MSDALAKRDDLPSGLALDAGNFQSHNGQDIRVVYNPSLNEDVVKLQVQGRAYGAAGDWLNATDGGLHLPAGAYLISYVLYWDNPPQGAFVGVYGAHTSQNLEQDTPPAGSGWANFQIVYLAVDDVLYWFTDHGIDHSGMSVLTVDVARLGVLFS